MPKTRLAPTHRKMLAELRKEVVKLVRDEGMTEAQATKRLLRDAEAEGLQAIALVERGQAALEAAREPAGQDKKEAAERATRASASMTANGEASRRAYARQSLLKILQ